MGRGFKTARPHNIYQRFFPREILHGMFSYAMVLHIIIWVGAKPRPPPFPYNTTRRLKYISARSYNKERARAHCLARVC